MKKATRMVKAGGAAIDSSRASETCAGDVARELDRHVTSVRKKARELGLLLQKRADVSQLRGK